MYQLSAPRPLGANAAARRACAGVVSGRGGKGALPWWAVLRRVFSKEKEKEKKKKAKGAEGEGGGGRQKDTAKKLYIYKLPIDRLSGCYW